MSATTNLRPFLVILVVVLGSIVLVATKHAIIDPLIPGGLLDAIASPSYAQKHATEKLTVSQLQSDARVQILKAHAREILVGMKKVSDDNKLIFRGTLTFDPNEGDIWYETYDTPKLHLTSADHRFSFQELTNNFESYISWGRGSDVEPSDYSTKPTWSHEEAIRIGTAFRDVFTAGVPVKLGKPVARYTPPSGGKRLGPGFDFHAGEWWVYWPRLSDEGYVFGGDGVEIRLSETEGVVSASTRLEATFEKVEGKILTDTEAIKIAKKCRPAWGTPSNDIVDYNLKTCDLQIVSPGDQFWRPGRLAYVIWLSPVRSTVKSGPTYNDSQEVTVDAHTGTILGQNAML